MAMAGQILNPVMNDVDRTRLLAAPALRGGCLIATVSQLPGVTRMRYGLLLAGGDNLLAQGRGHRAQVQRYMLIMSYRSARGIRLPFTS
jgi:hypothetical protein